MLLQDISFILLWNRVCDVHILSLQHVNSNTGSIRDCQVVLTSLPDPDGVSRALKILPSGVGVILDGFCSCSRSSQTMFTLSVNKLGVVSVLAAR